MKKIAFLAATFALAACNSADEASDAPESERIVPGSENMDATDQEFAREYEEKVKKQARGGFAKVLAREFDLSDAEAECVMEVSPMPDVTNPETRAGIEGCGVDPAKFE